MMRRVTIALRLSEGNLPGNIGILAEKSLLLRTGAVGGPLLSIPWWLME